MKFIILICFTMLFIKCSLNPERDLYNRFPKGCVFNKNFLYQAEQILKNNSTLIVVVNTSNDIELYDPHLLFFDSTLKLSSACYLPSEKVEYIRNYTISYILNEDRNTRKNLYRNDLPPGYKFESKIFKGESGHKSDKLVDSIFIDPLTLNHKFFVHKSTNAYAGINWKTDDSSSINAEEYLNKDSVFLNLSELRLDYKRRIISFRKLDSSNRLIWDEMIVSSKMLINEYYNRVFKLLTATDIVK